MLWGRHREPESRSWACFLGADPHKIPIDPNGNVTSKTEGTDTWAYTWNAENQLTKVEKNAAEVARFAYDPSGRRVEKVTGVLTTSYLYDRDDVIRESRSDGAILTYVHGPQIDEPLARETAGARSYYHADALGSVVKTTDGTGAATSVRQYDSWGHLQAGGTELGYAFTGREWDAELGLYYYRARYYEPLAARFVSEDPESFSEDTNFYAYVGGNPVLFTDPTGLRAQPNCGSCSGAGGPGPWNTAANRACRVVSTPTCQKALGADAKCMTKQCQQNLPIVCDETPYCQIPGNRGHYPAIGPTRVVVCTTHPANQGARGRAITVFHEMLHGCKGPGSSTHVPAWRNAYVIPCFGTANPRP